MSPRFAPSFTRRHVLQALGVAALPAAQPPVRAAGVVTIRLSHVVTQQTPKGLALQRFKDLVEQRSAGAVRVAIYANSSLYGDADEMQALQMGAIDMLAPSLSKFGRIGFPEFEAFGLPFLFESATQIRKVCDGALGNRLLASLGRQRMVGLGFLDNGFKHMSANRPLLTPDDYRGLRMRVQDSRVIAHQMRALGAQPVNLSFGETRRALASGVVDGTENPISNFWTQRMHEVQTDLTLTQHGYLGYAVVAHRDFWGSLPAGQRTLVQEALREALAWGNTIAQQENDDALVALRASRTTRIHQPDASQRERLRLAVGEVYDTLEKRIGGEWMRALRASLHS
ncbi:DctP family TRAP transporter solute-binding subunit [Curvibacter sp. APW13]|uniref:DctP family TRAP transporter solute-binding subunit n=1 Tax=Curvibacter sp. APW13 TaxID=3077236 RepID=UPI0028E02520|nr:DctP family TRAP transporter solute-binding subunit [Curvibacter sp. APW13]MDT8990296.1 DctP family TRAP transporter solute-binding subunit [Curvibacter sp. APW13]